MSTKDVIKKSVLESLGGGSSLELSQIVVILVVACLIGIYIFFIYKSFTKNSFYSKDLNITIAGMSIVVAAIMIAMQSNLIVSLGMVGALSIVRFRTAIKNPLDLLFLFWSISGGIICGVSLYALAIVLCIVMTLIVWLLNGIPTSKAPLILMVKASSGISAKKLESILKKDCSYWHQSSVISKNGENEYLYEIQTKDRNLLLDDINALEQINSVSVIETDSEIRA